MSVDRREYFREWRRQNAEKHRQYFRRRRAADPDKWRAYDRLRYAAEREKRLKYAREKYKNQHEILYAKHLEWCAKNPDKIAARAARRRARKSNSSCIMKCPQITAVYFISRWLRSRGECVHVDHIMPLARGGIHSYENLRIIDGRQNSSKGSRLPSNEELRISKILRASKYSIG